MGILSGNPKNEPLHYGEVMGIWSYAQKTKAMYAGYQTLLNHAGDKDLRDLIEDLVIDMKKEIPEVEEMLKANGIGLPPAPPDRPKAALESIPAGARVTDPEIAATIAADVAVGLTACSQVIGQAIREDVHALFLKFHSRKAVHGLRVLRLNKEKGWLVPPPLHVERPELAPV
ncbi:DUF3231 family protein [Brevibacillus migulae]|uniref:DUF3231 family protein n=1 Tax=Brevibacillus migulae TaxID=1644114 RepID=UPI00106E8464|nr:DUF3231 family protein [Brevibacillus migulae]